MSAPTRSPAYWRAVIAHTVPDAHGRPTIEHARRELAALDDTDHSEDTNMTDQTTAGNAALFAEMFGEPQDEPGVPEDGRVRVAPGKLDLSEVVARYDQAQRDEILLALKLGLPLTDEERVAAVVLAEHEQYRLGLTDAAVTINNNLK